MSEPKFYWTRFKLANRKTKAALLLGWLFITMLALATLKATVLSATISFLMIATGTVVAIMLPGIINEEELYE